jgi:hypothetical protein
VYLITGQAKKLNVFYLKILIPLKGTLKMIDMVSLMSYIFYPNKKVAFSKKTHPSMIQILFIILSK